MRDTHTSRFQRSVPDSARCLDCGYLLRGLPEPRCPECGRPFDPDDPGTYRDPTARRFGWLRARLRSARPPGIFDLTAAYVILAGVLAMSSSPAILLAFSPESLDELFGRPVGMLAIVYPAVVVLSYLRHALLLRRARRERRDDVLEVFRRYRRRWRAMGICVLVMLLTIVYPWQAYLRFYANWFAFHDAAQRYLAGDFETERDLRIGFEHIEYVFGYGRGFVFFQTGHIGDVRYGYVYLPNHPGAHEWRVGRRRRLISPHWFLGSS